jgi:HAAS
VNLTDTGESRVNGYLFVLGRSLAAFLPTDVRQDAVREIESHLRERIAAATPGADERAALETILAELGPPLRVAQAYSAERTIDEAVATGRFVPMLRAIRQVAGKTVIGFWAAVGVSVGYTLVIALLTVAVAKPLFPDNVGLWVYNESGIPHDLGMRFPAPANEHVVGGYWIVPICLILGVAALVWTNRLTQRFLGWWRKRRRPEL